MTNIRWDKTIEYSNYEEQADGSFALGDRKKLQIKALQPTSPQAVALEDQTISREYLCIAQPNADIEQGSICYIDNDRYLVSGILPYIFEGKVSNNIELTLRIK